MQENHDFYVYFKSILNILLSYNLQKFQSKIFTPHFLFGKSKSIFYIKNILAQNKGKKIEELLLPPFLNSLLKVSFFPTYTIFL